MTTTTDLAMLYTAHPALLVHFCGNCGERLFGAAVCPHCNHKSEPPQCGDTGAVDRCETMTRRPSSHRTAAME